MHRCVFVHRDFQEEQQGILCVGHWAPSAEEVSDEDSDTEKLQGIMPFLLLPVRIVHGSISLQCAPIINPVIAARQPELLVGDAIFKLSEGMSK